MKTFFRKFFIKILVFIMLVLPFNGVDNIIDEGSNVNVIIQVDEVDLPIAW